MYLLSLFPWTRDSLMSRRLFTWNLFLVKTTIPVVFWLFETTRLVPFETLAEMILNLRHVLYQRFNRNSVNFRKFFGESICSKTHAQSHLRLYMLQYLRLKF